MWRGLTDGRFRGTHRVRGGFETGAERPPQPSTAGAERPPHPPAAGAEGPPQPSAADLVTSTDAAAADIGAMADDGAATDGAVSGSVLAGTPYDAQRGERATLLQFSSAFCAPCRATRRTLADVAEQVPGVSHVEVDAEAHLDLVRSLGILRTPTTLVLDEQGREVTRASGAPKPAQVLAALERSV
jgi:thiol-disulfide isomerase/thioredoxin